MERIVFSGEGDIAKGRAWWEGEAVGRAMTGLVHVAYRFFPLVSLCHLIGILSYITLLCLDKFS